jgi:hypothetical protein
LKGLKKRYRLLQNPNNAIAPEPMAFPSLFLFRKWLVSSRATKYIRQKEIDNFRAGLLYFGCLDYPAPVAQLDRVPDFEAE